MAKRYASISRQRALNVGGCMQIYRGIAKMVACLAAIVANAPSASAQQFCDGFTATAGGKILFADFNGDSRTDVLCHFPDGKKQVHFANANGTYKSVVTTSTWCGHGNADADVLVGNFNGDKYADVLCTDRTGAKWIEYGKSNGAFTWDNDDWANSGTFCSHKGAKLYLGYFNADKRTDLLCHDDTGKIWIAYAKSNGEFFKNKTDSTEDWSNFSQKFCSHSGATFSVADMNNDQRDDLVCRDATLQMWVQYADTKGQFFGPGSAKYTAKYDYSCRNTCTAKSLGCIAAAIGKHLDVTEMLVAFIANSSIIGSCDKENYECEAKCPAYPSGTGPPPGGRHVGPVRKMH